jgi:hypothetical protein
MDSAPKNMVGDGGMGSAGEESLIHHTEAVSEHRQPYGPSGFRGLSSNYYVFLCAAFSTLGVLSSGMTKASFP